MTISIKEIVDDLITEFESTNTFENPFISKAKLRLKLFKKLTNSKNVISELDSIVYDSINELVIESVDTALNNLIEKDLIKTDTIDGEIIYKLNNNINE